LLWIGSVNSGNDREPVVQRIMLAIDAVGEMMRRYRIDESRVYVAGLSGGGRMASQAAMAFPDVFSGAMPIAGVDYYRQVPVPNTEYQYRAFARPGPELLRKLLTESRLVLVTGEKDFNKPQTEVVYRAMVADRFRHAHYLEQPGLGHANPDAEWFDKALALLDEPVVRSIREHFADGEQHEQLGRFGRAVGSYEAASSGGGADREVAAEAGRKAAELRKLLADSIAVIEAKIVAKQTDGVAADVQKLKDAWTPLADDAAAKLMEKLRR
jgi:pimeloyl-ACP methyl ester carboxylesterase